MTPNLINANAYENAMERYGDNRAKVSAYARGYIEGVDELLSYLSQQPSAALRAEIEEYIHIMQKREELKSKNQ